MILGSLFLLATQPSSAVMISLGMVLYVIGMIFERRRDGRNEQEADHRDRLSGAPD